jgi:hypothetical protein
MGYDAPMTRPVASPVRPLLAPQLLSLCVCTILMCSCTKNGTPVAAPLAEGALVTAGARCQGGKCTCRTVDNYGRPAGEASSEGDIAAGQKRFEFRTGRGFDKTTVTIESRGTLVKETTLPEPSCAYVDLPPGAYHVVLRAAAKDQGQGIQPRLVVAEYGSETHDWYDSFAFSCTGEAQRCIKDDMNEWFNKAKSVSRGIFDKCGSTRVTDLGWHVEHSPEQTMEDLTLEFVLHVYKFPPRWKHGTPTCKGLAGGRTSESELDAP